MIRDNEVIFATIKEVRVSHVKKNYSPKLLFHSKKYSLSLVSGQMWAVLFIFLLSFEKSCSSRWTDGAVELSLNLCAEEGL